MTKRNVPRLVDVLLVEDNPGDIRLTREALKESQIEVNLHVTHDGIEAWQYLNQEDPFADAVKPDLILLDLNMPRMDGRELLARIKTKPGLKHIPTIVLTTSSSQDDIVKTYQSHTNCFVTKPVELDKFIQVVREINEFWFTLVQLPREMPI